MVLSNKEIEKAIKNGLIVIDPLDEDVLEKADTTSINLRLGKTINIPKQNLSINFDLSIGKITQTLSEVYTEEKIPDTGYILEPGRFILSHTHEYIELNFTKEKAYAARVEGKSSFARCGLLVHFTAPTIHAGFAGTITLELINLGKYPIILKPLMPICQLIFETVEGEIEFKKSQFHGQRSGAGNI